MGNQNPGIRKAAKDVLIHDVSDVPTVVAWTKARGVDLAVIGPEAPLAAGVVGALDAAGGSTGGPEPGGGGGRAGEGVPAALVAAAREPRARPLPAVPPGRDLP